MNLHWYRRSRQALLGLGAAAVLAAQAPQVGFQLLGSIPTGSMRESFASNTGYGAGVFGGWEAGPGRVFRLAYDGVWYSKGAGGAAAKLPPGTLVAEGDRSSRSHAVTLQYLCYPSGDDEGVYFKAGLGGMNCLARSRATVVSQNGERSTVDLLDETGVKLATLAGIGFDFGRNWGVLAQYSFLTVDNHTLGAVQAGLSYRF
jgi:hypothetical protein